MHPRAFRLVTALVALAVVVSNNPICFGRGGGRGGGGGGFSGGGRGGGSFSRPSGGSSSSRPSGGGDFSRPSGGGDFSRPSSGNISRPSGGDFERPSGGRVPSDPSTRPSGGDRIGSGDGGASQLPSGNRPARDANRPSQLPSSGTGSGIASRPGNQPAQRPSRGDAGNFLGVASGVAGGAALANRAGQLPAGRPGAGGGGIQRPAGPAQRPEQRPNWADRSQNRNQQWQQRVDNRHESWNNWQQKNQDRLNSFQGGQQERWNNINNARDDRSNWRNENREDWQKHREELWDYRSGRANETWNNARDYCDDLFDDRWWGRCSWGYGFGYVGFGNYPANPWWWWRPAAWGTLATFAALSTPDPVYLDYGMNVNYEGDTVYVDNQPVPAATYTEPMVDLAVNAELPSPPGPPAEGQQPEWLSLGVFALAQEEKGEPIMFMQLSVSRAGIVSGAYTSLLSSDQRPIAGQVDKASQRVSWRIGANTDTIFDTTVANLTQDVSPVAIHFGSTRTQVWLLIRMPEPPAAGQPAALPEISNTPLPQTQAAAPRK